MSIDDGYAVQDALLARWREDGRVLVGLKAGLTSQAKMDQMGVTEPSFGMLMGDTLDPDGGIVPTDKLIHPRVEAEIAFVTKTELSGIDVRSEEHTSELQSLMRISYAVFCLKKKTYK